MAELSAVPFSALPQASDGYTVLYENDQVCRSEKKLSELVGDKTSSFLTKEEGDSLYQEKGDYLVEDDITGKLDKEQYANDSATFLTAHQNLDEYATMKWVEEQNYITGVDLTNYYTKSETSGKEEIETALEEKQDKLTFAGTNNTITSINNSAVGGGAGAYVPLSATDCEIGSKNTASSNSLAQGIYNRANFNGVALSNNNSAENQSFAQGLNNSANGDSLAQGTLCYAINESIAQGLNNSAMNYSFAQGKNNSADNYGFAAGTGNSANTTAAAIGQNCSSYYWSIANGYQCTATYRSLAQGERTYADSYSISQGLRTSAESYSLSQGDTCYATQYSFAQGCYCSSYGYESFAQGMKCVANGSYSFAQGYYTTAKSYSQAMGNNLLIQSAAMAIGEYNKTTNSANENAAFVIGNGNDKNRSDAFVVYKNGDVFSKNGYFYDKDGRVGNYHSASATITNTGTEFTITLTSNNSYVVLNSNDVSGTNSLNITIVPPTLEENELLDCMVQFSPVGGQTTSGHTVSANGLIQVGLRKYSSINLNYIPNGDIAQIRLLGNTYCLM